MKTTKGIPNEIVAKMQQEFQPKTSTDFEQGMYSGYAFGLQDGYKYALLKHINGDEDTMAITVERRTEEILSNNPYSIHPSRLESYQFREAIRFLSKEIDILHRLRINIKK